MKPPMYCWRAQPRFSKLKRWGMDVAKRRGSKRAKVALARKIAVILHRMWVDGTNLPMD
jgi:transposase